MSLAAANNSANRLASTTGPWGTESFTYDATGNRLNDNTVLGASTTTRLAAYPTTNNRISSLNQNAATFRTYTYDGAGNISNDNRPGEAYVFTYNKRNRPASLKRNAVAYATYGYNALDQQVTRSTSATGGPTGTVGYIYDLEGHLIAETNASTGATTRDYIWQASNDNGPVDLPLAVAEAASLYMVHSDHLGRPIRMTDSTKATVFQAVYKPYGEVQSTSGTKALNLRFPGQYSLIETRLNYNWHRHYDPVTGRYTQADPLRFVDGPSVYAYAHSSPFMYSDRNGNCLEDLCIGEAILVSVAIDLLIQLYSNNGHIECVNPYELALSGVIGGVTGGLGGRLLTGSLRGLSNITKGNIGENLSTISNTLKGGRQIADTNSIIEGTGLTTKVDSQWKSIFGSNYVVESKFGTSTLTSAQRIAQRALGDAYHVKRWSYGFFTGVGAVGGGAVDGGAVGLESR